MMYIIVLFMLYLVIYIQLRPKIQILNFETFKIKQQQQKTKDLGF